MPKPTLGVQIMSFWGPNGIITKSLASMRAAIVEHGIGGDRGKCAGEPAPALARPAPPAAAEPQRPLPMVQNHCRSLHSSRGARRHVSRRAGSGGSDPTLDQTAAAT